MVEVRENCHYYDKNVREERTCTEENKCALCIARKHREEKADIYAHMGKLG